MEYYRHGDVKISVATAVAAGFMLGAWIGALFVQKVPVDWLRLGFGGLLLYVGFSFVFAVVFAPKTTAAAALPAGLATVFIAIGAWLRGKRMPARVKLPPPDGQTEYHI